MAQDNCANNYYLRKGTLNDITQLFHLKNNPFIWLYSSYKFSHKKAESVSTDTQKRKRN